MARHTEALAEIAEAQELDPLSLFIHAVVGRALYFSRRHDAAMDQWQKTLQMDPDFGVAREWHVLKVEPIAAPRIVAPSPSERHGGRSLQTLNPKGSVGNARPWRSVRGVPSVARGRQVYANASSSFAS